MRKIGGQSGLQLALGLLKNNYEVTVVSDRTAAQIFDGRVGRASSCSTILSRMSATWASISGKRNARERKESRLYHSWSGENQSVVLGGETRSQRTVVDQRIKFPGWMNEFANRGGDLVIKLQRQRTLTSTARRMTS
jgi:hypothetical protein